MTLISLGGIFDKVNSEYYVDDEPKVLKNIKFDKYILLCDGVEDGVVTIKNEKKIDTIKFLLTKTDKTILLAPFNKFGKKSLATACTYKDIQQVISNGDLLPRYFLTDFNKYNVTVDLV